MLEVLDFARGVRFSAVTDLSAINPAGTQALGVFGDRCLPPLFQTWQYPVTSWDSSHTAAKHVPFVKNCYFQMPHKAKNVPTGLYTDRFVMYHA
jgi:hypothetical protein